MIEIIKAHRNKIFIGIGVMLMLAGFMGNIFTFAEGEVSVMTGAFRYVERIKPEEVEELVAVITTELPSPVENVVLKNQLKNTSYFLHPEKNKALEVPLVPYRIEIPAIKLVAPIKVAEFNFTDVEGETFGQWIAPSEFAAAWHPNSALLGQMGNTVINGHHNEFGEVFAKLVDLKSGDFIFVYAKGKKYTYVIANKMILEERGQPLEVRTANAEWLGGTNDERLTLVTCWPQKSNTHRLIIVARPY